MPHKDVINFFYATDIYKKRALVVTKALLKKSGDDLLYLWPNAVPSAQAETRGINGNAFLYATDIYKKVLVSGKTFSVSHLEAV